MVAGNLSGRPKALGVAKKKKKKMNKMNHLL